MNSQQEYDEIFFYYYYVVVYNYEQKPWNLWIFQLVSNSHHARFFS